MLAACGAWALVALAIASASCGETEASPTPTNAGGAAIAAAGAGAGAGAGAEQTPTTSRGGAAATGDASGGSALANGGGSVPANGGAGMGGSAKPTTVNLYFDELRGREGCLPRPLPVADSAADGFEAGQARCQIDLATLLAVDSACSCDSAEHLKPAASNVRKIITSHLEQNGTCGGVNGVDCQNLCVCELEQSRGEALAQCQTDATPIAQLPPGFCYVDATVEPPLGNPALVASCPQDSRRELRILGPTPQPTPFMFVGCTSSILAD
jgi:hypothetical protein